MEPDIGDFESREYQVELYTQAIDKNLILYLPTGSGKTFIATLLIKHFNGNKQMKDILAGGQRTFFLVNTVALVEQQAKQIRSQTTFSVGTYSGNMKVDMWDVSVWHSELNKNHVLVMTSQIFLDLLQHNTVSLRNVNLAIFDECHRAVSNHPMRQIMMMFEGVPVSQQPRVLGLTATLLNGNVKSASVDQEIRELEKTFLARIATSVNEEMVKMYSTNPFEKRVTYTENNLTGVCYTFRDRILNKLIEFLDVVEIDDIIMPAEGSMPSNTRRIDDQRKKTNKRLINIVDDIKVNMDELGVYGGTLAVLAHLVQVQQLIINSQLETAKQMYQCITADLTLLRKVFDTEMEKTSLSAKEKIRHFSSNKAVKLLDILKKLKDRDSAIVFVTRRFTAKILYYLTKKAAEYDPSLKHIKSNFIVGYNVGNPLKDTRENYLQNTQNRKVMKQFNEGELNVLIASNVVEEGIDITQCNYVIMYDLPKDFRSYIQSKGRARDQKSIYIMMINHKDDKFMSKYEHYCGVERALKHMLYGGKANNRPPPTQEEIEASLFFKVPGLEPYRPKGPSGPVVTCLSAITLINRYFGTLKLDKFTKICPFWYIEDGKDGKFRCYLELPIESKVREVIKGTWQQTKEDAKRSVALEAVKKLYENGELDEINILPITISDEVLNVKSFTPNVDSTEVFEKQIGGAPVKIGTKRNKRLFEKKWADCLCDCRPNTDQHAYLYVLDIRPNYTPPQDNNRLITVHQILCLPNTYAIISSKEIPKIAPFPLYMSTGELEVNVKESYQIILNEDQMEIIEEFHFTLFDTVLHLVKPFLIKDTTGSQNSYLIAPVKPGPMQEFVIDWDAIGDLQKPFPSIDKPSDVERMTLNFTNDNYLHRIVSPWYRMVTTTKYLITNVCHDMSENSTFPTDSYPTYKEYFKDKYNLEPFVQNQPLIEVRALSSKLNCTKPRALTKVLKRKNKEENEDFEVWLLPEFCVVYPLHSKYWLKAELLPSILHRISRLCIAEELRSTIARELKIGFTTLPEGQNWKKLEEDACLKKKDDEIEFQQALKPLTNLSKSSSPSKSVQKVWGMEEEPLDIERHMDTATIFDIINYNNFIQKPLLALLGESGASLDAMTGKSRVAAMEMVKPPPLKMLQNSILCLGPEQTDVMQALSAAVANDFINCERLETLGDSFLKFVISLALFESQPDFLEGHLTHIKGSVVGNRNLYFCGKRKDFGSLVEVQDFSPKEEWVAPGFCVEPKVKQVICAAELDTNCLYKLDIPDDERKSGILSASTMRQINDILFDAEDATAKTCAFINQQALSDKTISDCVEAVLGVYLKTCGLYGALRVLKWFGVTKAEILNEDILTKETVSPAKGKGNPDVHLQQPLYLEELLNYKFKDRCYMLQAVTHPSYTRNNITLCYQRLEFLGDALIDFLITIHIFEKCQTLSPGDLTDLRSALVNNITLGALSVRHQLYKFMLYHSSKLNDCMMRFVKHQEDRNHVIDDDILYLVEENEVNISEAVDVPKALGDIFEALVGAIYLDSGKDLDVVWKVVYNLMKNEIETFHKNIPKNHVRMLYETNCGPKFSSSVESDGAVMVTVEILHKGVLRHFNGFGDNKHQAKRAASKHALRYIRIIAR